MNCNRAGELLGAYARNELPPSTRAELEEHLDRCTSCRADLEVDQLVLLLPRVDPPASLRTRIFSAPEFLELTREISLQGHPADEAEAPIAPRDLSALSQDQPGTNGHHPQLVVLRPTGQGTKASSNGHSPPGVGAQRAPRQRDWQRLALRMAVAAAVLVLVLGSALGIKTLLSTQPPLTVVPTFSLEERVVGPLAAGERVVYLHDGRLWSAPEQGPEMRRPLTDTTVTVAPGWAVAPAAGPDGVHHLAYIDLQTGTLHSIQTDDARDTVLATLIPSGAQLPAFWQSAEGQAVLAGLAWSPDARQLAFVSDQDGAGAALWVMNASGSAARAVSGTPTAGALPELPAWSADGLNLAYVLAAQGATSIWDVNFSAQLLQRVVDRASPQGDEGDVVHGLFWTTDTQDPTLTWSAGAPGSRLIKSLWSYRFQQSPHLARLTSFGATFSAVDYNPQAGGTGAWLVAQNGIGLRSVHADGSLVKGLASGEMLAVQWSPDGSSALYVVAGDSTGTSALWSWTPLRGQVKIANNVALAPLPVWSPDAMHILYAAGGQVLSAVVAGKTTLLASQGSPTALSWSPNGTHMAFAGPKSVQVSAADGSAMQQVDNVGGVTMLVWTAVP
jgi:Tol biopolymer transport system component